jgi:hypothetical protein
MKMFDFARIFFRLRALNVPSNNLLSMNIQVFLVIFTVFLEVRAAALSPLQVSFTKIETRVSSIDTVKGTIYSFDGRMVIAIVYPITQFMLIDSLTTLIYNKEERVAVQIQRKSRSILPFFHTFIGFFSGEQAIPVMYFKIDQSFKKGDTLITCWVAKDKKSGFKGKIETAYWKDRPISTSSIDKKGRVLSRMVFSNDTMVSGKHVPLRIVTRTMQGADTLCEDVSFSNLQIGTPVPDSIRKITIPSDIPVKVLEW